MNPHRRQENQFSFSSPIHKSEETRGDSDAMEYNTWAEKMKSQYNSFGKQRGMKLGAWTRRLPLKNNDDDDDDNDEKEDADSLVFLSAASSPVECNSDYNDRDSHFSQISHSSMAKYRQEMLKLVQDLPETAYELSLRDIVETPKVATPPQETVEESMDEGKIEKPKKQKKKKKKKEKSMSRSESIDAGGLLLRLFIPRISSFFSGWKKSGKSETCTKVSPKPMLGDGEKSGSEKSSDREWSRSESREMSSRGSSRSSSGRRRSSSR